MRFYSCNECPVSDKDTVFKARWVDGFLTSVVCVSLSAAIFVWLYRSHAGILERAFLGAIAGGGLILIGLIAFGGFRASLKKTNWLLRFNSSGIIIKYRSYLNWRMPLGDVQAVQLRFSELVWVRKSRVRRDLPSLDGKVRQESQTCLDFALNVPDYSQLEANLNEERSRRWNSITYDYPVELLPNGILRVRWNGISPGAKKTIKVLSRHLDVAAEESFRMDLTQRCSSLEEEEKRIRELTRAGNTIEAIRLTRAVYGCSLAEAKAYVETFVPR